LGQHGAVNTDEAVPLVPLVKRGDVGEADEGFRGAVRRRRQLLEKSHRAVATASAEHCSDRRICEGPVELGEPASIVARQILMFLKDSRIVLNAVPASHDGQARAEGLAIEWAGRGNNGDRLASAKGSRLVKNRVGSRRADQSDNAFRSRIRDARPRSS
jgi:hypothetical protein